jgi:hypothetical protein
MWIIYLEMALVFALAVFIVWWTLPSKRKPPQDPRDADKREP